MLVLSVSGALRKGSNRFSYMVDISRDNQRGEDLYGKAYVPKLARGPGRLSARLLVGGGAAAIMGRTLKLADEGGKEGKGGSGVRGVC